MSQKTRTELKAYFETGDKPTEAQFIDLFDSTPNFTNEGGNYKRYTAFLYVNETDAPVATVLENSIGNIVWTRPSTGVYVATLADAFPALKTFFPSQNTALPVGGGVVYPLFFLFLTINTVSLNCTDDSGDAYDLVDTVLHIEIRVYN